MPNPKGRHSKARNRRTRALWQKRIDHASNIMTCENPECGAPTLSHHVCEACGFYKGKKVIEIKTKE
jgi:large subunit ribosomal protein L32